MKSTSREWYYHPVDEFIFQEYSDRRDTELIFDSGFNPRVFLLNRYTKELNAHWVKANRCENNDKWQKFGSQFVAVNLAATWYRKGILLLIWITKAGHSLLFLVFFFFNRAFLVEFICVYCSNWSTNPQFGSILYCSPLFALFETIRAIRDNSLDQHPFVGSLVENCLSSFKCNTGFGNRNWIVRIACLCQRKVSDSVLNKEADRRILIFQWRKGYFDLVGVWRCEDITWHRANFNLRWDSNSNKWIKSRSTLRSLRSSLRYVFLVSNQFDPVKKASSVMAASVCSNHSSNTETQFKLVRLSTGVAGLTCDIPEAEGTALSETSVSVDRDVDFNSSKITISKIAASF